MRAFISTLVVSWSLVCAGRASAQELPPPVPLATPVVLDAPPPAASSTSPTVSAEPPQSAAVTAPSTAPAQPVVAVETSPTPVARPRDVEPEDGDADDEETSFGDATLGPAGRIGVGAALDLCWYLDRAHEAFTPAQGSTGGGLFASLTILEVAPRWLLDVGVGWRIESSRATLLQSVKASYESNTGYVDAALRFEVTPWFVPRARVSVGVEYLAASLAPNDGTTPLEGGGFSLTSSAGAGVELLARVGDGVTSRRGETAAVALSLIVEGGLVLGTNTALTVKPREPSDAAAAADLLPVVGTKLGSLGGVAPYLRIAGAIRF